MRVIFLLSQSGMITISGRVYFWTGSMAGVTQVSVSLNGPEIQSTSVDSSGNYQFQVSTSGVYTLSPTSSTSNSLQGLTSDDTNILSNHTLGVYFTSPYQYLAGDINNSKTITSADTSNLSSAIAGNPVVKSLYFDPRPWVFVDVNFEFTGSDPWTDTTDHRWAYPTSRSLSVSSNVTGVDFIGVKLGDLNGSADPTL